MTVIWIEFSTADLAGVRFAHSPMVEAVASSLVLAKPDTFWMYAPWRARVLPLVERPGLETFLAVVGAPTGYVPDFLTPVPPVARPSLDDELRTVAATPLDDVAAQVHAAWAGHPAPPQIQRFATDPAGALAVLVRQARRYFAAAVAPAWPRLRAAVEAEIAGRARTATEQGPATLLSGLDPRLDWDGSALRIACFNKDWQLGLDGYPLALLPTGFAGPMVYLQQDPSGQALWYPPRGYGRLAEGSGVTESGGALAALLGSTRAAILMLLGIPHSTGEVAGALGLAPATASHHLTTLRDAGLVAGDRTGRRLRYLRTGLGEQVTQAGGAF